MRHARASALLFRPVEGHDDVWPLPLPRHLHSTSDLHTQQGHVVEGEAPTTLAALIDLLLQAVEEVSRVGRHELIDGHPHTVI